MNSRFLFPWWGLCVIISSLSGCRPDGVTDRQSSTLVGRIQLVGNEPFTALAVETGDGEVLIVNCDQTLAQYLRENQGKKFQLTYTPGELTPRGRSVNVVRAEQLPNGGR